MERDEKRRLVKEAAEKMDDSKVLGHIAEFPNTFYFHDQFKSKKVPRPKQCFKTYTMTAKRFKPKSPSKESKEVHEESGEKSGNASKRKRQSTRSRSGSGDKIPDYLQFENKRCKTVTCAICEKNRTGNWLNRTRQLYRVSEIKMGTTRASKFLSAMTFNEDNVHKKYTSAPPTAQVSNTI